MATTVVVADDRQHARAALREALSGEIRVLAEVTSGPDAARETARLRPDVLLINARLGSLPGVAGTSVLVFTEVGNDVSVLRAMRSGALGYLLETAPPSQIVRAVHSVAAGAAYFDAKIADYVTAALGDPDSVRNPLPQLTGRQHEVLELLAAGLPNPAIARQLGISSKTVRNHVSVILTKLGVKDRSLAADLARKALCLTDVP
ncbi:hypothetical protein SD37_26850 [Amycolatopsis orientalis]|uniref:DNA-binding response regulator n=1 Tax=Amycolatopsis orientalis TaxID=31958 RepID=A0A193C3D2_AMYOR|nr:response regulator transcription factor [Amycolatopsis orientalis]ANN18885.1 hypothetical protein SD37_26850 [Amycolatopsis orientalis]